MNENEKISCNNDDHKCKNTNTKLLYKNDGLEASPDDVGACLSTGRSTKWWSQKLHKKEYGHMVICMEIVQDMVFSTYYRLGFRLLGLSCVLVQTHHLHRPKAHLRSLCCFKAFAKEEKSEFQFSKSRSWAVGHRSLLDERQTPPHCGLFFVDWSQDHFVAFHQLIILTGQGNIRELLGIS